MEYVVNGLFLEDLRQAGHLWNRISGSAGHSKNLKLVNKTYCQGSVTEQSLRFPFVYRTMNVI